MFSIGEFSKVTGMTIKTLRFYHEQELLVPRQVDVRTGYRYYDELQIEQARTIACLRGLEFPLEEIKALLDQKADDEQIVEVMQRQREAMQRRVSQFKRIVRQLDEFISEERRAVAMAQATFDIRERTLDQVLIAGIRMKGQYSDCGRAFGRIGKSLGRYISGKPFLLLYDTEYKEDDADFEACMPVRQRKEIDGISLRQLPAARCVCVMHKGPYGQLGKSYAQVLKHVNECGYTIAIPTREVYVKGAGLIFKGNPRNYLTEIQIPVETIGSKA